MLTEIRVSGFKSLVDFNISFNKGLNVLIGPNGAGKTTICQAIGLISSIAKNEAANYILSVGGAQSAFTLCKVKGQTYPREMKLGCTGLVTSKFRKSMKKLRYEYDCNLALKDTFRVMSEDLTVQYKAKNGEYHTALKASRSDKLRFDLIDREALKPSIFPTSSKQSQKNELEYEANPMESFLPVVLRFFITGHSIINDLYGCHVLNIDPNVAKQPSDLLEPSEMLSDGRNLANALADLEQEKRKEFQEINDFIRQICPRYDRIVPETDEQKLMRSFSIIDKNDVRCPAASLSDGTIKTVAVLTAIMSRSMSTAVIEEPENYLHPWACQILVDYLRTYFKDTVCVLTTHSETILNGISPSELIVCTNDRGITNGQRIQNVKEVSRVISETGFGCGYHYVSGGLGGTPE